MRSLLLILLITSCSTNAQCDYKTVKRPDNNELHYYRPVPVIRQSGYEVAIHISKNVTTNVLMLNLSVLFKSDSPNDLTGELVIQTANIEGLRLKPILTKQIEMNGRPLATGIYKIDPRDYKELSGHKLKSLFFELGSNLTGATVTENKSILMAQLKCLKYN